MTFQYFIGLIIVTFALDFAIVALLDGVIGMFYRPVGDRYVKVIIKRAID
jgi:hypothetical protein